MLDEKDLQAIAKMIGDSEARTAEKISVSEARTAEKIGDSEARLMAMMEACFDPKFNLLADALKLIQERLGSVEDLENVEERVDVLETVVQRHSREIETLKKAQ